MTSIFALTFILFVDPAFAARTCRMGEITNGTGEEQQLLYHLLSNYEKSVRPVLRSTDRVELTLGVTLTQLMDVDERNQVMTVQVWLDQMWTDVSLKWNKTEWFGIDRLQIPCDFLWLPDLVLYNSVDDYTQDYMRSLAVVTNDGTVFWPPIVRFRVSCLINITYFPFDDQICRMKIGSWLYDGKQLNLNQFPNRASIELGQYTANGEWELVNVCYEAVPIPYHDITFYLHIRRKTLYYTFNIIVPCLFLSTLTMIGFRLPPDSGEKVTLGLTILLAYSVFTLLVADTMPPTSDAMPLIGVYITLVMGMTAFSVVTTIWVLEIHHSAYKHKRKPPRLLTFLLFDIVNCELFDCVRLGQTRRQKLEDTAHLTELEGLLYITEHDLAMRGRRGAASANGTSATNVTGNSLTNTDEDNFTGAEIARSGTQVPRAVVVKQCANNVYTNKLVDSSPRPPERPAFGQRFTRSVDREFKGDDKGMSIEQEIVKNLQRLLNKQLKQETETEIVEEWQKVGAMIDRLMFYLFIIIQVSASTIILLIKPTEPQNTIESFIIENNAANSALNCPDEVLLL